jgi:hypothetical protein
MIEKTIAFLDGLSREDLDRLPPARLQQFAQLCQHWHRQAEARRRQLAEARPRPGVLSALRNGDRAE